MSQTYKGFTIRTNVRNEKLEAWINKEGEQEEIEAENLKDLKSKIDKFHKSSFKKSEAYIFEGEYGYRSFNQKKEETIYHREVTITSFNVLEGSCFYSVKGKNKSKMSGHDRKTMLSKTKENLEKLKAYKKLMKEKEEIEKKAEELEKSFERFKFPAKVEED